MGKLLFFIFAEQVCKGGVSSLVFLYEEIAMSVMDIV